MGYTKVAGCNSCRTFNIDRIEIAIGPVVPWSGRDARRVAFGVVTFVAIFMVWSVLGAAGVWDSIDKTVGDIVGDESGAPFRIEDYLGMSRVLDVEPDRSRAALRRRAAVAALGVLLLTAAVAALPPALYDAIAQAMPRLSYCP